MNKATFSLVNNQLQSYISVIDRGLAYGDGVFETMAVQKGDIDLWSYHYDRLMHGLQCLSIHLEQADLFSHIYLAMEKIGNDSGVLKLMVTRGEGGRGYLPDTCQQATLISQFYPHDEHFVSTNHRHQECGVTVHYCKTILPVNSQLAGLKTLNQLPYVLASQERIGNEVNEGILSNSKGHIIEATARNVFLINRGKMYTPLLELCGVAGVMRRLLIEKIAPELGIDVIEAVLSKADFARADEVFLVNGISRLWPVVECENQQWCIGEISKTLQLTIDNFLGNRSNISLAASH